MFQEPSILTLPAPASMSTPFLHFEPYIDGITVPRPGMDNHVYPTGYNLKGQAIYFETGQWGGRIIRAELHELQHANIGRKYAESDRILLDPPPVVALRLSELTAMGQENERSDYENIETAGLLCVAELIPVVDLSSGQHTLPMIDTLINSYQYSNHHMPTNVQEDSSPPEDSSVSQLEIASSGQPNPLSVGLIEPPAESQYDSNHYMPTNVQDSSFLENSSVPESEIARMTANVLVGTRIVRPHLIELDGQKHLLFVFSDLSVRILGLFRLRYKFFDLFSATPGNTDTIIQAECMGGIFRVFSTKDFPGLRPPTGLTNTLSAQGISFSSGNSPRKSSNLNGCGRRQSDGT
ncbi:velvet factor-domain-containing protein [Lentinula edodes]|uniref:Velvet factor-domain-containing protein n=1 Tax=Lentinula lateritia TaxID=40482 RepID=A0A9W9AFA4_9AGAR|nr:velvet factor-domain-containing protein [Lentinula edodes]